MRPRSARKLLANLKRVRRAKLGVSLSIPRSNRSKTSPLGGRPQFGPPYDDRGRSWDACARACVKTVGRNRNGHGRLKGARLPLKQRTSAKSAKSAVAAAMK